MKPFWKNQNLATSSRGPGGHLVSIIEENNF
ncbi:hypothetical protein NC652_015575 [Populus alba x Populus x berolinensis]|nr:hypothetical protein NC652_015575 [Populus alba x Populus x berolinensis]